MRSCVVCSRACAAWKQRVSVAAARADRDTCTQLLHSSSVDSAAHARALNIQDLATDEIEQSLIRSVLKCEDDLMRDRNGLATGLADGARERLMLCEPSAMVESRLRATDGDRRMKGARSKSGKKD